MREATTQGLQKPTVAKVATVQLEGGRTVVRQVECYNSLGVVKAFNEEAA